MGMEYKAYECVSCAYIIFVEGGKPVPSMCPLCRSPMNEVAEPEEQPEEQIWQCEECGSSFMVPPKAQKPYKCIQCNATFPSTPGRKGKYKL